MTFKNCAVSHLTAYPIRISTGHVTPKLPNVTAYPVGIFSEQIGLGGERSPLTDRGKSSAGKGQAERPPLTAYERGVYNIEDSLVIRTIKPLLLRFYKNMVIVPAIVCRTKEEILDGRYLFLVAKETDC